MASLLILQMFLGLGSLPLLLGCTHALMQFSGYQKDLYFHALSAKLKQENENKEEMWEISKVL